VQVRENVQSHTGVSILIIEEPKAFTEESLNEVTTYIDVNSFAEQLEKNINVLAAGQYKLWSMLIDLIRENSQKVCNYCVGEYDCIQYDRWSDFIYVEKNNKTSFSIATNKNTIEAHEKVSTGIRTKIINSFVQLPIESTKFLTKLKSVPIVIQETYLKDSENEGSKFVGRSMHLFVLVHGYQGSINDLRIIKSYISLHYPYHKFLFSKKNQSNTKENILDMGKILANEVKSFIKVELYHFPPTKISFIGHSLGGLIIRAALPYLSEYKPKFHLFMSLSTPHLGIMYNNSSLVSTGIWFLNAFTTSKSLQQLSMNDNAVLENTALYTLSTYEGLEWFKCITLVSSHNDSYSPFESSRVELSERVHKDLVKGGAYIKMAENILSHINTKTVYKLDVDFKIDHKQVDKMIGRAAHIEFLDDEFWIKIIVSKMPELFE
jgi:Putative serine esterase (DUF676)